MMRPKVVVETGVADGLSSAVILEALASNGGGELHSVDIANDVGSLIRDKTAWRLHLVSEVSLADDLQRIANAIAPIDMFLHDANHDYRHQMLDYTTFWQAMAPGGIFLSDDVDYSYAFLDFATQVQRAPTMLLDSRKILGSIRRQFAAKRAPNRGAAECSRGVELIESALSTLRGMFGRSAKHSRTPCRRPRA